MNTPEAIILAALIICYTFSRDFRRVFHTCLVVVLLLSIIAGLAYWLYKQGMDPSEAIFVAVGWTVFLLVAVYNLAWAAREVSRWPNKVRQWREKKPRANLIALVKDLFEPTED